VSLLELVVEKRPEILRLAEKHGVRDLRIFGSVPRGQEHSKSDLDFLGDGGWNESGRLSLDLQDLLGVRVDVVTNADPVFKERVLPGSISLSDPNFKERIMEEAQQDHEPNDRDERHVRNMIDQCDRALSMAGRYTREQFLTDDVPQYAIVMCVVQIGEQAARVTDQFQIDHPEIPWRDIVNFRNKAVHEYMVLSLGQIWDEIIQMNIPELKSLLLGLS
jgi:uncharacterized protein with HEPN domain/predicted nucleotidyltransferase